MKQPDYPIPAKMPYIKKDGTFQQRCNWTAVAKEQVQMAKRALRTTGPDTRFDFSDAMVKRRIHAVADYADKIIERYRAVPGYEPERKDETGASWIFMNFAPSSTYNHIEKQMDLLFAVSIWILDEILLPGDLEKRKELFRILPKEDRDIDNLLNFPDCWHACYEDTLILSVMYVLYYRNRDAAPMEMDDGETERVIMSSIHAKGEQNVDVPSRQAFEALMALIPEESIRRAAAYFEELFWLWTDRYFECILPMDAAIRASRDRANGISDEFNRLRLEIRDDLDAMMKTKEKRNRQTKKPVYNPLLVNPTPLSGNPFDQFMAGNTPVVPRVGCAGGGLDDFDRIMRKTERLDDLTDRFEAEMGKYEELETGKRMFAMQVQRMGYIQHDQCVKDYGEEVAETMNPLRILNPYEACFGLLWLIESDSDLPWLYGSGCGLMNEVSEALPWGVFGYKSWQDSVWEPDDEEYADNLRLAAEKPSSIPEWYERSYVPKNGELFSFNRSMAQILYEETGCIMPRDIHKYDGQQKLFRKYGVPAKEMNTLLLLCTALSHARRCAHALNFDGDVLQFWDEQDREEAGGRKKKKQPVNRPMTREELEEQLKLLQEENKKLRSSLHEAEKSSRESRKELLSARNEAELDRRELADLRELIFILDHEAEEKESTEAADESGFPYEVMKETVVFGGHDSWLKAIRPMLTGNIRFMDREVFNASVIRNADVIWIQPNAISHSQYYRIVDAARQDRKPVRYFTYASAAKGAVQLMEADMA